MALTIKDIANLAGVSRGTVDRVLHNRGRVAPEIAARVRAIAQECNYQPNRAAQQLSMYKKNLKFGFISRIDQNVFWSIIIRNMERAEKELREYGISIEKCYFDYCLPETQLEMIDNLVAQGISALVIVPLEDPAICQRLQELSASGIPVVLLQSELEGFEPLCYIGSDYYVGGRTAAGLLYNFTSGRSLKILLLNGSSYLSSYSLRHQGFLDEINSFGIPYQIIESDEITMDPEYAQRQAYSWLERYPDVDAIFTVPDSAAAVSRVIRDTNRIGKVIHIGYGMTDATRPCILDGSLNAAIGHRAENQGYIPFSILLDYFATGKIPESRRILMLNDIFIKQNSIF